MPTRCPWCNANNPTYVAYHDHEWGVPLHDDHRLFEILLLEAFQAGLSWECVLNKREAFRQAFCGFDCHAVAALTPSDVEALMQDKGIIRNRLKIKAAITNAQVFMDIQREFGSFDAYIWHFTRGSVVIECDKTTSQLSDDVSADLRKRGMRFAGSTMVYSLLQAIGVIDSHTPECFLSPQRG